MMIGTAAIAKKTSDAPSPKASVAQAAPAPASSTPASPLLLTPAQVDFQRNRVPPPAGGSTGAALAASATLEDVIRTAVARYPSIESARATRDAAHFDVASARAGHFPSVTFNGQRRIVGTATNLTQPQLNLNLYASGAIEAGVEREQWREHSLSSTLAATREDVAYEAAAAWFRLYRATTIQAANLRNLERHSRLVEDFAAIASIDTGRRYDLIQARSRTEQVRQTATTGEAEIASARAVLARFYPRPVDLAALMPPPELPDPPLPGDDTLIQHPNVEAARRSLLSAEAHARATRAARGPRLDLAATTGAYSSTVLQFSWPAFDLARTAAEDSAGAALAGARAAVQEQELIVRERQQTAFQAWRAAMDREKVAVGQVAASNELVDVYRQQFQIGRRNLLDLLNAFAELYSAEASRDAARVDRAAARYQLEYAAGRLSTVFDRPSDGTLLPK